MIDKKGRLFGFINIIDLVILLIIGAIIIVGVKRMDGPQVSASVTKEGLVTYEINDVRDITVENIHIGEPLYHYDKSTYIGEIVEVDIEDYYSIIEGPEQWIKAPVPGKFRVTIVVKADIEENDQYYTVGAEQTRVGIQYRLKNKSFSSFGTCIDIEIAE